MKNNQKLSSVFPDFVEGKTLNDVIIQNANLYKSENRLEIFLKLDKIININELANFKDFLIKKFKFSSVKLDINTTDLFECKNIEEVLEESKENIFEYIFREKPFLRGFIDINKSKIGLEGCCLNLISNGEEMLKKLKVDTLFSEYYNRFFNIKIPTFFEKCDAAKMNDILKEKEEKLKKYSENILKFNEEIKQKIEAGEYVSEIIQNKKVSAKKSAEEKPKFVKREIPIENKEEIPKEENDKIIYGKYFSKTMEVSKIINIGLEESNVYLIGKIVNVHDTIELKKSGKFLLSFDLYDKTSSITCKLFANEEQKAIASKNLKEGSYIELFGKSSFDDFSKEITLIASTILKSDLKDGNIRIDKSEEKRVELHLHTQSSQMDGVTSVKAAIKRALNWGWKGIAITDHGVVQAFPEASHIMDDLAYEKKDFKVLYGVEGFMISDENSPVHNCKEQMLDDVEYCLFDIETTGLSYRTEKITEIGIIKIKNGEIIDTFETFVNPEKPIPPKGVEITNITDEMVKDAPKIEEILPKIIEFFGDSVLVAHNADFDTGFMRNVFKENGYVFDYTYLDTLLLAKMLFQDFAKYKLTYIAEKLGIKVEVAHRALDDVKTTLKVFNVMCEKLREKNVKKLSDLEELASDLVNYKKLRNNHITLLAKNYIGLRNLYKLVSISHVENFYRKPLILKSILKQNREGLLIGTACSNGEIYDSILSGKADEDISEIINFYDYVEVQSPKNYTSWIDTEKVNNIKDIQNIVKKIIELSKKEEKLVCATGDVHFLDPEDEIYRRILQASQKLEKPANPCGELYLKTTDEMLADFSFLGENLSKEIVIENTNKIFDLCEKISPLSSEKCAPHIPGCEQEIEEIAYKKAHELYGEVLPEIVESRLKRELNSIISNGFSVMYIIAQKLVWKSNEDGYIVGSRGSVGSSFAAFLTGITEVNSLPAHYRCSNCKHSDFNDYGVSNGFDLPDKKCPVCGNYMDKDGMDIPFETFLGFNGDKEPDIDLNFSGEYQAKAHKYTEVIFGKGTTYKAGTVGTVADKTAFGFVKKYHEENSIPINNSETVRISKGCIGVKRTSGQHPGGIIVVPKGREIYEFTPVQHPADDPKSDIITTHFDYHSIDQNLLKLDILGHDDPTIIRMLYDLTGFNPIKVPLDDKATMAIYSSTETLGVTPEEIKSEVGTYGIPESGTKFVRGMFKDTKPTTFDELIRISGLSHGTDVWLGNAKDLIDTGVAPLNKVICTRDDIMIYLIKSGLKENTAFKIMELVRKGKVLKTLDKWAEFKEQMEANNVPDWYIESCKKIKYLFPKAHAAAYVTNAFRIAWFKVHIPKAYYCAYFSIRALAFDSEIMCNGQDRVKNKMREIEMLGMEAKKTDQDMYETLEIVNEMYARGLKFLPINLYESDSTKFLMKDEGILPPLNSLPGFGTVAADSVVNARKDGEFSSIQDLKIRAKLGKIAIEVLQNSGCLKGMSESNQISLF